MPSDITIPPEALEAGARAMQRAEPWSSFWSHEDAQKLARAAFLAMVKAWPGMETTERVLIDDYYEGILKTETFLTLPLPQEPSDGDDDKRAAIRDLERQGWTHPQEPSDE